MATYSDFDGCWFTISSLRAHHPDVDLIVVDNHPTGCPRTKAITEAAWGKYFHRPNLHGTSAPRDEVFRLATTPWVMVCDSHVIFPTGAIASLLNYILENPESKDLIQGPLVYDNGGLSTHWRPTTLPGLWGTWDYNPAEKEGKAFEIPMQGLGIFAMNKDHWPGFNPLFTGFGGEEGYIHELVRRRGGKALCLPSLGWRHRFRDPNKEVVPYPLNLKDHVWNLLVGHQELGIDAIESIRKDFGKSLEPGVFEGMINGVRQCQSWNQPGIRPEPLKILGVWYSNNTAPVPLLQKSLASIHHAKEISRTPVRVVTCPHRSIQGNPLPETIASFTAGPGHLNIIRQVHQCLDYSRRMGMGAGEAYIPDVVCFLEHDVLYPPDYFDRVAKAFMQNPVSTVVSNLDYEGLNETGWLTVRERHEPMHQLSIRYGLAVENLTRATADCERQGWAYLEPDHEGDRSKWARLPPRGIMPAVHVNHKDGRLTSHGEVVFNPVAATQIHKFWGPMQNYWPHNVGPVPTFTAQSKAGCASCSGQTSEVMPPSMEAWYDRIKGMPSDFHKHMDYMRELSSKCGSVTEVSGWNKPAILAMAAGTTGTVTSYCHAPKQTWGTMQYFLKDRFVSKVDANPAEIAKTDLLFIDTYHRAGVVYQQLKQWHSQVNKYLVIHCTTDPFGEVGDDGSLGVMPGIRGFLKEHNEWSVIHHATENHGLLVLSRLAEDRKESPSVWRKGLNFAIAKAKHLSAGRPTVPLEVFNSRMDICLTCEYRLFDTCSACGCPLEAKLSYATEPCGLVKQGKEPKWPALV